MFTADLLKEGDFPWFDRDFLLLWKRQEKKSIFNAILRSAAHIWQFFLEFTANSQLFWFSGQQTHSRAKSKLQICIFTLESNVQLISYMR